MVRAVVAVPEPTCVGAGSTGDDLVTEADPEQRTTVGDRRGSEPNRTIEPRRIARTG
jgi:hypothetical protein